MFLYLLQRNKTVKSLRRNAGYTAQELAVLLKQDTVFVLRYDSVRLGDVPEGDRQKLIAVLKKLL